MTTAERREHIISLLNNRKFIKISDIVTTFNVSNETARRDLDYLQDQNMVRRVYGGAVLEGQGNWPRMRMQLSRFTSELDAIGKAAADLVKPGDAVFLGPGSTTLQVARYLCDKSDITVVTSSMAAANLLSSSGVPTYILGGLINRDEQDVRGDIATECIKQFFFDIAFLGCGGVTLDHGLMDFSSVHIPIHSQVVKRSNQRILVASSKKFGTHAIRVACSLQDINTIITDTQIPEVYYDALREKGIRIILTEADHSAAPDLDN